MNEAEIVVKVVNEMKPLDHFIFYLRIERGMELEDICDITGIPKKKINAKLQELYNRVRERCESLQ